MRSLLKINIIGFFIILMFLSPFSVAKNVWEDWFKSQKEIDVMGKIYPDYRRYDEVCWLTSHNSFAYNTKNPVINNQDDDYCCTYNIEQQSFAYQEQNILEQLSYGVRSFMIDLHHEEKKIFIAHKLEAAGIAGTLVKTFNFQYFYKQPLRPFLETIRWWLEKEGNENEIITIHLETYVKDYSKIIKEIKKAGLYDYLFDKSNFTSSKQPIFKWPTLGEMRKKNSRLVIFSDKDEDCGYGIMSVSNTMETKYDLQSFPDCEMREDGRVKKANLFIMNHFDQFIILNKGASWDEKKVGKDVTETNEYKEAQRRVLLCKKLNGKFPNFISYNYVGRNKNDRKIVIDINKLEKGKEWSFYKLKGYDKEVEEEKNEL